MSEKIYCECCRQSTGYRSKINRGIVKTLKDISHFIGQKKGANIVNVRKEMLDPGLVTYSQYANMTHLLKHGLVAKIDPGNYALTRKAMHFLEGGEIHDTVDVMKATKDRGSRTEGVDGDMVTIQNFNKEGEYWEQPGFEIKQGIVYAKDPRQT